MSPLTPEQRSQRLMDMLATDTYYRVMESGDVTPLRVGVWMDTPDGRRRIKSLTWRPMTPEEAEEHGKEWSQDVMVCIIETDSPTESQRRIAKRRL